MARIEVPGGPGGAAARAWTGRPPMDVMVETMVGTVAGRSILPAAEREPARMRIAQLDACGACATDRAPSVVVATGVDEDDDRHLHEYRDHPGDTERRRLAVDFAEGFATDHAADHAVDHATDHGALVDRLRRAFADEETLDRTLCVAVDLGVGRAPAVLGIDEHAPDEA
ncbi:MAG TPA: hypothetical protein VMB72_10240 [Acidimicrobiales bacterium]|nr:hypothetical protein [Acidimicrobiales bacterium]